MIGPMVDADDEALMGVALQQAEMALAEGVFPVGAILAQGRVVVGVGRKDVTSRALAHAEINLFRSVFTNGHHWRWDDGLTLFTTLEPCVMCFGTTLHLPIARLVYAMPDPWAGCTHLHEAELPARHAGQRLTVKGRVRASESAKLFAKFLARDDDPRWTSGPERQFLDAVRRFT